MADRAEKSRRDRREPHPLAVLAGVLAAFLLLAACYVGYQALHILFPQNVYETALPANVSDSVEADGVLLFDEVYVSGSGTLGNLAAAGERVSAGTAVAEIYSDASQAVLRQQLTQLTEQIDLLQRSQNTTSLQLDTLLRERSAALYDMMDELDAGAYDEVSSGANAYLLAQNKLWIATGDSANFTDQVTALTQQAQSVQAQLGNPTQITAPQTGYFVRASSSGRLNAGASSKYCRYLETALGISSVEGVPYSAMGTHPRAMTASGMMGCVKGMPAIAKAVAYMGCACTTDCTSGRSL